MGNDCQAFVKWFQNKGGTVDLTSMELTHFPASEGGRGAVALKDLEEGHILFSVPREVTMSTRTSSLPSLFGMGNWHRFGLDEGWSGLILSMMWETAQGPKSKWAEYLHVLPTSFDTPMFWDDKDLEELKGTSIIQKLGKEDAEKDYQSKLKPAIESRPDLFPPAVSETYYSYNIYHIMGSRILSRSFNVEKWQRREGGEGEELQGDTSVGSAMDIDEHEVKGSESESHDEEEDSDDEDEPSDPSDTAMVPMADMLNARYEQANASLFYEENVLNMVTTQPIKAGDQIWNTYNDLPNSELLRRYGHVDWLPLENGGQGNPGDAVEMPATVVVDAVKEIRPTVAEDRFTQRIDWWLEEGGDDIFDFDWEVEYPEAVFSLIRLLLLSDSEWEKAQEKSKLPKPKPDAEVLTVLQNAITKRLDEYSTSIEAILHNSDDEALLQKDDLHLNLRNAVIVRLGEKKILDAILAKVGTDIAAAHGKRPKRKLEPQSEAKGGKKCRH